ncbi:hypothetical protein [Paenibacillus spongiae]|uniref:Integral inner membrane protein n=1 Tax=Paenibacillus spongiae TaxID=2909671 RepID=A0ABY5S4G6_9BACL|nr:hypothetical protein [Paenibacillus spongiae]UVI28388.1 hypothetical protein L1F29_23445 [Paenibacillus spongiae]
MSLVAWMIVACEIAFWCVILLGLVVRYVFKKDKLGYFLLCLVPVIDLALLIFAGYDLLSGAVSTKAHGIAAVYIGVSLAFGKSMIQWADERFQYYIMKQGPAPVKRYGLDYAKHYLKGWLKHVLAYLIGAGLLAALIYFIQDPARTESLSAILKLWSVVLGIDLIITVTYFLFPKTEKAKS